MAKGLDKRKTIFDKYVYQLKTLNDNGLIPETIKYIEGTYICPICFNEFSEDDLSDTSPNMLTLEDAPPKSLGGKANTLTCKSCNNKCGHEIDFHLTERLVEIDVRSFLPSVESKAKFFHHGIEVQGSVNVDEAGKITVIHSIKNNHPEKLDKYISTTGKDDVVEIAFKPSRVEIHRLELALLKSAYILAFEQYGYALILNKSYDIVREQLLNPEMEIYPEGFWTKQSSFSKEHEMVFYVKSREFEGFYSIFSLKTKSSKNRYGVYLPISVNLTKTVIDKLKEQEGGFGLEFESLKENDYFEDIENMRLLTNFINSKHTP